MIKMYEIKGRRKVVKNCLALGLKRRIIIKKVSEAGYQVSNETIDKDIRYLRDWAISMRGYTGKAVLSNFFVKRLELLKEARNENYKLMDSTKNPKMFIKVFQETSTLRGMSDLIAIYGVEYPTHQI